MFVAIGDIQHTVRTADRIGMDHHIPIHLSPTRTRFGCLDDGLARDAIDIGCPVIGRIGHQDVKKSS